MRSDSERSVDEEAPAIKEKKSYRKVKEYPGKKFAWGSDFQEHLLKVRKAMVTNAFGPDKQKIDYFLNTLDETTEPLAQSLINGINPKFEDFLTLAAGLFIEGAATEEGEDFLPPAQRQLKSMRQEKLSIQAYSAKIQKVFNTAFHEMDSAVKQGKMSKTEFDQRMTEIERDAYAALTLQSNPRIVELAKKQHLIWRADPTKDFKIIGERLKEMIKHLITTVKAREPTEETTARPEKLKRKFADKSDKICKFGETCRNFASGTCEWKHETKKPKRYDDRKPIICDHCKKPGHTKDDCYILKNINKYVYFLNNLGIDDKILVDCEINKTSIKNLFLDTGSSINCMHEKFAEKLGVKLKKKGVLTPTKYEIKAANNQSLFCKGTIKVLLKLGRFQWQEEFFVIADLAHPVLIGNRTMRLRGINIDFIKAQITINQNHATSKIPFSNEFQKTGKLHVLEDIHIPPICEMLIPCIGEKANEIKLPTTTVLIHGWEAAFDKYAIRAGRGIGVIKDQKIHISISNFSHKAVTIPKGAVVACYEIVNENEWTTLELEAKSKREKSVNMILAKMQVTGFDDLPQDLNIESGSGQLSEEQRTQLLNLIRHHKHLFAKDNDNPGQVDRNVAEHAINVQGAKPISEAPRRTSPHNRQIIRDAVKKMIQSRIIEPSRSPWAAPVVLVPKKKGEIRFAIDYRKLNEVTKKEIYPLPRMDDTLDAVGNAQYFSTFDLASGYWQIPMSEADKEKTAFVTYEGQYQYNVMPFGLCNAPATFQRLMDTVLAGLKWQNCLVYLDDVIVFSNNFNKHLEDLNQVLTRLAEAGLKLKAKKCHLCCEEVEFLGHVLTNKGIKANPEKLDIINKWPIPESVKQIQSFLGFTGYYRRLIRDYAIIEAPLRKLTRNYVEFKMGDAELGAFNLLKSKLTCDPIIGLPDFSGEYPFEVHVDASDLGLGAVLCQKIDDKERVILYISRTLTKEELKWHTKEKEALGIVWSLLQFKPYLLGQPFIVRTDHESLQWLYKAEKGRLARWALALAEFDFQIIPRKGNQNANADALSRNTIHAKQPTQELEELPYLQVFHLSAKENGEIHDLYKTISHAQKRNKEFVKSYEKVRLGLPKEAAQMLNKKYSKGPKDNDFIIKINNKLLCRELEGRLQVLIPLDDNVIKKVLYHHHDAPMSGHLGRTRTQNRIQQTYYWPGIRNDVKKYVNECLKCQVHKAAKPNKTQFPIYPSLFKQPNARIGIDLTGPFPITERKNQYILACIDYFSKYAITIPIRDKSALSVADALYNNWYCKYGIPYEIHSDQGGEFTADLIKRLNDRLAIDHRITTPYNPSANGEVERFNQTFKNALKIYAEEFIGTWDLYLPSISFAYNTSIHEVLGYSPFYIWHGREARLPTDVLEGGFQEISNDIEQYQMLMTHHLSSAYKIIRKLIENNAIKMKLNWDKNVKKIPKKFKIGDKVLFYNPQLNAASNEPDHSHVFQRRWKGPFVIIDNPNPAIYRIRDTNSQREFTVNINKLKEYDNYTFINNLTPTDHDSTVNTQDKQLERLKGISLPIKGDLDTSSKQDAVAEEPDNSHTLDVLRTTQPIKLTDFIGQKTLKEQISTKEFQRIRQRDSKRQADPTSFQERALSHIISHRRGKFNQIEYLIRWENESPDKDEYRYEKDIFTKKCLLDYWYTKPRKDRPTKYKSIEKLYRKHDLPLPQPKRIRLKLTPPGNQTKISET